MNNTKPSQFNLLCEVISNQSLNESYFLLTVQLPQYALSASFLPGCFVQVKVEAPNAFLRRPISVCRWNLEKNTISLLIQEIGRGTSYLRTLRGGDKIDLLGPLGNSFDISSEKVGHDAPLLIGGGVGVAPMLMLAEALYQKGITPNILLGARTSKLIVLQEEFKKYGSLYVTTDDGSQGVRGTVLMHPILTDTSHSQIFTCGPRVMMKAVAIWGEKQGVPVQVSLENTMACGIGACLCCVENTKDEGNVCVCTEGPVFNANRIRW